MSATHTTNPNISHSTGTSGVSRRPAPTVVADTHREFAAAPRNSDDAPTASADEPPITKGSIMGRLFKRAARRTPVRAAMATAALAMTALVASPALTETAAAAPQVNAYCKSYNGGTFTASADDNHLIAIAVQKKTASGGWSLVAYSSSWEWNNTSLTKDYWGRAFSPGVYRVTAWTYRLWNGPVVGHEPSRIVHWDNPGGIPNYRTYVPACHITSP